MSKLVQMKALMLYTTNSPANGAILHGDDRSNADIAARFPLVSEKDAAFLEGHKPQYAERYEGKVPLAKGEEGDGTGMTIDERAGVMVESNAEAEDSVEAPTGLSTRDTTAFERPVEELAGSGGVRSMVIGDITEGPAVEADAPAGRDGQGTSREGQQRASGGRSQSSGGGAKSGSDNGGSDGPTPYAQMKKADLEAEAAKEPVVDLSGATNNEERAKLLEKARGAKAPAADQQ